LIDLQLTIARGYNIHTYYHNYRERLASPSLPIWHTQQ
jgi:hypothetical protein